MTVDTLSQATVKLFADQVFFTLTNTILNIDYKVVIMDLANIPRDFSELTFEDKDLTMFTITSLRLEKREHMVQMVIVMKRKIQTEMLTTYLPTILLLGITYATTFFKPMYFEAVSFVETYIFRCVKILTRYPLNTQVSK